MKILNPPMPLADLASDLERQLEETRNALRESEQRLQIALMSGGVGVWDTDLTTGLVRLSEGTEALFGLPLGPWVGSVAEFLEHVHPDDRPRVARLRQDVIAEGRPYDFEFRVTSSDGAVRWVEVRGCFFPDETGRPARMSGAVLDVTERKESEQELVRVVAQGAQLLSSISSVLVAVDETGCVMAWNGSAEAALGLSKGAALGQAFADLPLVWDWKNVLDGVALCKRERRTVRVDDLRVTGDGAKERLLGISLSPLDGEDGDLGFLLLAADITERRSLETQLAHAQKMESIGQLAAGIAHEINTPSSTSATTRVSCSSASRTWPRSGTPSRGSWRPG